jgi:hypothetical protein
MSIFTDPLGLGDKLGINDALDDAGLGAANFLENPGTALFDPGDLAGTKSGSDAKKAAKEGAQVQEDAIQTAIGEQRRQFDITTGQLSSADAFNRRQLEQGRTRSISALRGGARLQREQLDPFAEAGRGALSQQQALLGLSGQSEQDAAFNAFSESPGQRFIRERAQKSLLRNSSAIGGIGGGNIRSALVQQGAGFAAQDFGNQFNRLSDLRTSGQNAATNIGQGALTTGANIANTQFNAAQLTGAGAINTAARQGQFGQNFATNTGNLSIAGGQARASGIFGQQQAAAQQQQQQQQLATTAASFFSDERLKEDIKIVGNDKNGDIYNFKYLGSPIVYSGRIAQELQKLRPDAVSLHKSGYLQVTEEFKPEVIRCH